MDEEFESVKKVCPTCGVPKDRSEYSRNKRKKDGLEYQCKTCSRARNKAQYDKDPAQKIAKTRQYHLDHPEWSKHVQAEWHQANADRRYKAHVERGKDPDVRSARRAASRRSESRRRALKAGSTIAHLTKQDFDDILKDFGSACWVCGVELNEDILHWDHYQPLSRGGSHTKENLRPACSMCNTRKNATWPVTEERLVQIRTAVSAARTKVGG